MPKVTHVQTNFSAGELSPRLRSRADLSKYHNGLETCNNLIVLEQGGLARRPGTVFVNPVKFEDKATIAVSFQFSTDQAWILEFGDQYVRFYKNRTPAETPVPEHLQSIPGQYLEAIYLGLTTSHLVRLPQGGEVAVRRLSEGQPTPDFAPGQAVKIAWDAAHARLHTS